MSDKFIRNQIIEAGAGTGKTYTLTQLLIQGIEAGQFNIDNVAVITFTRKAAAELKQRVMQALQEKSQVNNEQGKRIKDQLLNIANNHISTIHSFCESLLKMMPLEADIDPAFSIIEDSATTIFFDNAFDRWLTLKLEENSTDFKTLCIENELPIYPDKDNPHYSARSDSSMKGMFQKVLNHRELDLFTPQIPDYNIENLYEVFQKQAKSIIAEAAESATLHDKLEDMYGNFMDAKETLYTDSSIFLQVKFSPGNAGGVAFKPLKETWKEVCGTFQEQVKLALSRSEILESYRSFNILAEDFISFYREEMRLAGVMDFTEIMIKTEELLHNSRVARDYFKNKFKFIFVDEFQDTDPLQTKIIFFLAEREGDFADKWEDVRLAENKLCVVGDPKQSIYRFRRADIEIYRQVADNIKKQGTSKILDRSFRSAENILKWVNDFSEQDFLSFGQSGFQAEYKPIEIADKEKRKKAKNANLGGKGDIIFVKPEPFEVDGKNWSADDARDIEAKCTAAWLKQNAEKYGKYGDITLLYRKYKNMQNTADYLEYLNIPCEVVGGRSFFGRQEVVDLNLFLRAVTDPLDSVAIFATLRGPFFSFTDAELCEWKLNESSENSFSYISDMSKYTEGHPVTNALLELKTLHKKSQKESAYSILSSELIKRHLPVSYNALYQGNRKSMNLLKVLEFLKTKNHLPAKLAVDLFSEQINSEAEMADFSENTGNSNAVKLMTIHKAKGLENRVVYLADTTGGVSHKSALIFVENSAGKIYHNLQIKSIKKLSITLSELKQLKDDDKLKSEAEETRLRYVAATRAIETLVINHRPLALKKGENSIFRKIEKEHFDDAVSVNIDNITPSNQLDVAPGRHTENYEKEWAKLRTSQLEIIDQISKPEISIQSPSLANFAEESNHEMNIIFNPQEYTFSIEPKDSGTVGEMVHKLLELQPESTEEAENFSKNMIKSAGSSTIPPGLLIERYKNIQQQTEKLCSDADEVMREVPIKYRDKSGVYYDGIIDLLIRKDDSWTVVDYKVLSANYTDKELKKKYNSQLNVYAEGLKQMGLNVTNVILLHG